MSHTFRIIIVQESVSFLLSPCATRLWQDGLQKISRSTHPQSKPQILILFSPPSAPRRRPDSRWLCTYITGSWYTTLETIVIPKPHCTWVRGVAPHKLPCSGDESSCRKNSPFRGHTHCHPRYYRNNQHTLERDAAVQRIDSQRSSEYIYIYIQSAPYIHAANSDSCTLV